MWYIILAWLVLEATCKFKHMISLYQWNKFPIWRETGKLKAVTSCPLEDLRKWGQSDL